MITSRRCVSDSTDPVSVILNQLVTVTYSSITCFLNIFFYINYTAEFGMGTIKTSYFTSVLFKPLEIIITICLIII